MGCLNCCLGCLLPRDCLGKSSSIVSGCQDLSRHSCVCTLSLFTSLRFGLNNQTNRLIDTLFLCVFMTVEAFIPISLKAESGRLLLVVSLCPGTKPRNVGSLPFVQNLPESLACSNRKLADALTEFSTALQIPGAPTTSLLKAITTPFHLLYRNCLALRQQLTPRIDAAPPLKAQNPRPLVIDISAPRRHEAAA